MKKLFTATLLLFFLFLCVQTRAQSGDLPDAVRQIIEDIAARTEDEESDMAALYEFYESLLEHPLNLNSATAEELSGLQLLTDFQIQSLLEYRKNYGQLYSIYELPLIHGFNEQLAAQLTPFVTATVPDKKAPERFSKYFTQGKHQVMLRTAHTLETRKGYEQPEEETSHYLGFPWSLYMRYRYKYKNNIQWGITATNGAGEPFFSSINRYGFDFYSAHFMLQNAGVMKRLVVGDYQVQFGQGLTVWGGFATRKSADAMSVRKQERGFTAHSGSDENRFFRGIAATISHKQWDFSAFVSYKFIDASLDSLGFKTLQTSGAHNTATTVASKHSLPEFVTGGNISHKWEHLKIGCTGLWHSYGAENNRDLKNYNRFELAEKQNANIGLDFYTFWNKIAAFGEIAFSSNGKAAGLLGLLFDLSSDFRVSTLYRHYDKAYQAVYAKGFGEHSKTANEQGWYAGLQWIPHRNLTVSAFADMYSFPWMKYNVDAPSSGWEYTLRVAFQATSETLFSLQAKRSSKEANNSNVHSATKQIVKINATTLRGNIRYEQLPGVRMEDRLELTFIDGANKESGLLLFHDVNYKHPSWPVKLATRLAVFDSDSWASRFYAYESDVLSAFSVPAYYSKGARWFLNMQFLFWERIDLWFRIAQTHYFDKTTIGSGIGSIEGSRQTDMKIQLRIRF
ncbi:MAG: helix-hairpin-helix domain-containing protein [Prevotellaceae bacterium]|jgi:hypothetical protein|nr:helix-hairpin-helix domain-containing protein [Prevotellaceae bacterium]